MPWGSFLPDIAMAASYPVGARLPQFWLLDRCFLGSPWMFELTWGVTAAPALARRKCFRRTPPSTTQRSRTSLQSLSFSSSLTSSSSSSPSSQPSSI
eukprot:144383-Pyramimonas_sp.AAC.1